MFLGSVFSPFYAAARRRGPTSPLDHSAINVALYDRHGRHQWILAEHTRASVSRSPSSLSLGGSTIQRRGNELTVSFDERTSPFPRLDARRLRGTIRLHVPTATTTAERGPGLSVGVDDMRIPTVAGPSTGSIHRVGASDPVALDEQGRHLWWLVAPRARVEVDVPSLDLRWKGSGYHDANTGERPLERDFSRWSWGRYTSARGQTWIAYDAQRRDGDRVSFCLRDVGSSVMPEQVAMPSQVATGRSAWGLAMRSCGDLEARPVIEQMLEDAPFYARRRISTVLDGERTHGIEETLDLDRFDARWVQGLLPFRMRRG